MKLFRFGELGKEQPGVLLNGSHLDVSRFGEDYDEAFFENDGLSRLISWLEVHESECPTIASGARFGAVVARPSKIVCVGLNYKNHALEIGAPKPTEPVIFLKATSAISGPFDNVVIPKDANQLDWEVELAIVINKKASAVAESEALSFAAGFTIMMDYSERFNQLHRGGQWTKGKSADTFAPLGPYLVTQKDIGNIQDLSIWLKVNGVSQQDARTSDMIFSIPHVISYISRYMTLLPGDVISTGTPHGIGFGKRPPQFLKANDIVEAGIEGIGQLKQLIVNSK